LDAAGWLRNHLDRDGDDSDLARSMLQALMSAEASMQCQAGYGERSEERTNSRNGYRERRWDTRVGSIDLAVPELREGTYLPGVVVDASASGGAGAGAGRRAGPCRRGVDAAGR